jgi:hypothetical protein
MNKPFIVPAHFRVEETDLLFHPDRPQDRDPHPLRGLLQFGPFSRSLVNPVLDPIRWPLFSPMALRAE